MTDEHNPMGGHFLKAHYAMANAEALLIPYHDTYEMMANGADLLIERIDAGDSSLPSTLQDRHRAEAAARLARACAAFVTELEDVRQKLLAEGIEP